MSPSPEPEISVVVSTYERPSELARVLEGYRLQTFRDFEVVVADDGSGPSTAEVVARYSKLADLRLVHARHEHDGFRAAAARNMGVRASSGKWIVFADGDCVPFPDFVAEHSKGRDPACFLAGDRYLLEEDEARAVSVETVATREAFVAAPLREKRRLRTLAAKNAFYRLSRLKPERPKLLTSNASLSRDTFFALNGLDERFVGWGREDDDLRRRLVRQGARPKSVVGRANLLHLWHPPVASFKGRVRAGPNEPYFQRGFFLARCRHGLERRPLTSVRFAFGPDNEDLVYVASKVLTGSAITAHPGNARDSFEVEVVIDTQRSSGAAPRFTRDAEVRVLIQPGPPASTRVAKAHILLHGAPGPTAEPAPARHMACLDSAILDASALEKAARVLDQIL